jgi:hypothetical protein
MRSSASRLAIQPGSVRRERLARRFHVGDPLAQPAHRHRVGPGDLRPRERHPLEDAAVHDHGLNGPVLCGERARNEPANRIDRLVVVRHVQQNHEVRIQLCDVRP